MVSSCFIKVINAWLKLFFIVNTQHTCCCSLWCMDAWTWWRNCQYYCWHVQGNAGNEVNLIYVENTLSPSFKPSGHEVTRLEISSYCMNTINFIASICSLRSFFNYDILFYVWLAICGEVICLKLSLMERPVQNYKVYCLSSCISFIFAKSS